MSFDLSHNENKSNMNNETFRSSHRVEGRSRRPEVNLDPNRASNLATQSIYGGKSLNVTMNMARNSNIGDNASDFNIILAGSSEIMNDQQKGNLVLDTSNSRISLK